MADNEREDRPNKFIVLPVPYDTNKNESLPELPSEIGIFPLRKLVIYPNLVAPLMAGRPQTLKLIDDVNKTNGLVALVTQQKDEAEDPQPSDLFRVGTIGKIIKQMQFPNNMVQIWVHGIARIRINEFLPTDKPYMIARTEIMSEEIEEGLELEALERSVRTLLSKITSLSEDFPEDLALMARGMEPSATADMIAMYMMDISIADKQKMLEITNVKDRLLMLKSIMARKLTVLELSHKIQNEAKDEMNKAQKEFFLRKEREAINRELGEDEDQSNELKDLEKQIEKIGMHADAKKQAKRELVRLSRMHPSSAEYTVSRTYLDWLVDLPWKKNTTDMLDIKKAKLILDEDHYDLEKVKDRILEYLAVRKLKADMKGPILCFVGPPGVGKTSLGKSIARAMGRKFIRMSLGGVRDEAEIRGHRRTYIGSLPGRIIQGIRKSESNNPVFMLDEVDKLGRDFRGDPSSALLEVLDPEQNNSFSDHYLEVSFDLSNVMFITTANILDTIPPALLDRMEVLRLPGYTEVEKLQIAKKFLIPKQLESHGLNNERLSLTDDAILKVIQDYTRESGVRNLEREIGTICRKTAKSIAQEEELNGIVTAERVNEYLGPEKFHSETAERVNESGVALGLAWTQTGGEIIFVEAAKMRQNLHKGESLTITGQLGDVMKESAQAALSYVKSKADELGIESDFFDKYDIHVHVPAGATPKDGPSAGITMATAIASLATDTPIKEKLAMTGEITLRGKVMPIGGLKEKVLAAHRAGITDVILPLKNKNDIDEIPEEIRNFMTFHTVDNMDEVLDIALSIKRKKGIKGQPLDISNQPQPFA
ncbi:MAG: endopeptidase La [Candidatus Poribacteria bacterium]